MITMQRFELENDNGDETKMIMITMRNIKQDMMTTTTTKLMT